MATSNSSKQQQQQQQQQVPSLETAVSQAVAGTLCAPLEAVILLLRAADKTADTIYGDIKRAAHLAAQAMAPSLGVEAKKEQVLAIYAQLWLEIRDPNIKRDFTNLLWIYADPKAQVTVPVAVPKGEAPKTQIVDAEKTLAMSKLTITSVSKQIREIHDAARAPGAGRPRNPTPPLPNTSNTVRTPLMSVAHPLSAAPTPPMNTNPATILQQPSTNPAVSTGTLQPGATSPTTTPKTLPAASVPPAAQPAKVSPAAPMFWEELKVRLGNPGDAARIHAAVEESGEYTVRRKANVPPASTKKDATSALAEKILETTPESVIKMAFKQAQENKAAKKAK